MKNSRTNAFTLVELLVVVGIIALLISILLPSLARAREQSRMVKCLSNQRELGKGASTFANDHKNRLQLVASYKLASSGNSQPRSAIDLADPTRSTYEYYDYPSTPYTGALTSVRNKELVLWTVAYAETAGLNFGKKNWKWGVRASNLDDFTDPQMDKSIERGSYNLATCPSDDVLLGSPGWPEPSQFAAQAVGFNPSLIAPGDQEASDMAETATGRRYYGELSYAMNEDIVGADIPGNKPGCFKGGGMADGSLDQRGGEDAAAGPRLKGDVDRVFQPSNTILTIDSGMDEGKFKNSVQRTMLINSDNFVMNSQGEDGDGLGEDPTNPEGIRANLGSFTWAHEEFSTQSMPTQVLPSRRHTDGQLNVLFADMHGATVKPVEQVVVSSSGAPQKKIPRLWSDGAASVIWITPYDVGKQYDYKLGWE